eukprot:TRINITY_DN110_c0_g3_i5.p5 TRINITY_DN110_c0_g3~~TRINITY_DN110_c0_g3_i5.p5  ORF type:complete len:164 (-),score=26.29 TRINITY_DN110_c0_g3_i5:1855-2277(-)
MTLIKYLIAGFVYIWFQTVKCDAFEYETNEDGGFYSDVSTDAPTLPQGINQDITYTYALSLRGLKVVVEAPPTPTGPPAPPTPGFVDDDAYENEYEYEGVDDNDDKYEYEYEYENEYENENEYEGDDDLPISTPPPAPLI